MKTTEIATVVETSGACRVTTASGSVYDVDTVEGLLHHSPAGGSGSTLILAGVIHCTVGDRARFLIDVDAEDTSFAVRETTDVVSIVRLG